jgi:hypothetical protein
MFGVFGTRSHELPNQDLPGKKQMHSNDFHLIGQRFLSVGLIRIALSFTVPPSGQRD